MSGRKAGWTNFLREQGSRYLQWVADNHILRTKFDLLAESLWAHITGEITTPQGAHEVWESIESVMKRCNFQETYEKPGAPLAFASLHLLERYVRSWVAMESLVAHSSLPMGINGVRILDVGAGPGSSSFAALDFYSAMTDYSLATGERRWKQPTDLTCVELASNTNHFRHWLSEIINIKNSQEPSNVLQACNYLSDFRQIDPSLERRELERRLINREEVYFDEVQNTWTSEPEFTQEEANYLAQRLHRYRLIIFSNFFTDPHSLQLSRPNLESILADAHPGTVVMVIGGAGKRYSNIYGDIDSIAASRDFERIIIDESVSSDRSEVRNRVFEERAKFNQHLQNLLPDPSRNDKRNEYVNRISSPDTTNSSSYMRAYRKYRYKR